MKAPTYEELLAINGDLGDKVRALEADVVFWEQTAADYIARAEKAERESNETKARARQAEESMCLYKDYWEESKARVAELLNEINRCDNAKFHMMDREAREREAKQ